MPADLLSVCAVGFMYFMSSTAIKVLLPLYCTTAGLSPGTVGIIVSAQAFLPMFLAVPAGALGDRLGFRAMAITGSLGMCVAATLLYYAGGLWPLVIAQVLMGTAELFVWLSAQALATEIGSSSLRGTNVGYFGFAIAASQSVAPTVAGYAADHVGYKPAFMLAIVFAAATLVASVLLPRLPRSGRSDESLARHLSHAGPILQSREVRAAVVCTFTMIFTRSIRQSFFVVFLRNGGFTASQIGVLISISELSATCIRLFLGRLMKALSISTMLVWGMMMGIVATAITPLIMSFPLLALAAVIAGLGTGVNLPLTMVIMAEHTPRDLRGVGMGIRLAANRVAQLVNPLLFGAISEWFTIRSTFFVVGSLLLGANLLTAILLRSGEQEHDRATA